MIRVYRTGDALKVRAQAAQAEEAAEGAAMFDKIPAISLVRTGTGGEEVLAVFGFRPEGGGAAMCFGLVGENAGKALGEAVRFLRRFIPETMKRRKFRRALMTVREDFAQGGRMARLLGFCPAEKLPRFFNNRDYQLFERTENNGSTSNSH